MACPCSNGDVRMLTLEQINALLDFIRDYAPIKDPLSGKDWGAFWEIHRALKAAQSELLRQYAAN
jgi:hypothetical protein